MAQCFTADYPAISRVLVTHVRIREAFDPKAAPEANWPKGHQFNAIWDTGATGSVITQKVVDACGIKPISMVKVHGVHGEDMSEVYLVNIELPNNTGFTNIRVTKGKLTDGADDPQVLIGMDIISCGDFAVTNYNGKTAFSFRMPSTERIDWVKAKPLIIPHGQGRNEKCACGSGKKYKNCCGKIAA